jgi:tRNA threonylcarbamoyladenosine biosynthesis protein TsaB
MRILALETTERIGTVAAMRDGNLLAELKLPSSQRSAQSLAPAMLDVLRQVQWRPGDVELVAVSQGPGSFTGLRVGIATAKVFAYSVGASILGIDTLEAIVAASPDDVADVFAVMDAQRGEVVAGRFVRDADGWFASRGIERLLPARQWLDELPAGIAVSGPILGKLAEQLPRHVRVLDTSCWSPRASVVARLAARHYSLGRRDDVWQVVPHYSRRSAAEEKTDL